MKLIQGGDPAPTSSSSSSTTKKSFHLFLSHVKKDTGTEAGVFFDMATKSYFLKTFLDVQQAFPLPDLIGNVKDSEVILVLLSPDYIRRPYTAIELITAHKSQLGLMAVNVVHPQSIGFDFSSTWRGMSGAEDPADFVQQLLDESAWGTLSSVGYSLEDYQSALLWLLNLKGLEYHAMGIQGVRDAEIKAVLNASRQLLSAPPAILNEKGEELSVTVRGMYFQPGFFGGHTEKVLCVSFSPDGLLVATCCKTGVIRIWNAQTRKLVSRFAHAGFMIHVNTVPGVVIAS